MLVCAKLSAWESHSQPPAPHVLLSISLRAMIILKDLVILLPSLSLMTLLITSTTAFVCTNGYHGIYYSVFASPTKD